MFPFSSGNQVFAGIENLVVENSDSPVELGRCEFLDCDRIGFLEIAFGDVAKAGFAGGFLDISAEAGVGCFDDDGFAQVTKDVVDFFVVEFVFVEEDGGDAGDMVFLEEGVLVDFVCADFDAFGVVDDFQAEFPSGFGHDVRREQRVSCGSDKDGIVVGYVVNAFSEEKVEFVLLLFGGLLEVVECTFFARVGEIVLLDEAGDFTH